MSIKIERIKKTTIKNEAIVSLKSMGNTYEICWCEHKNNKASISKVDKNHYIDNTTGELKECKHISNRSDSKSQLAQSFKRLREIINTNVTNVNNCKWITLTYRDEITDTKQVYSDFDKFIKRFKYKYGKVEYINVCEPQGNGRWHFHCLIIFPSKAPYIDNSEICNLWGNGFTKTQKLDYRIDNLGAYLSAHISDIEINEDDIHNLDYGNSTIKKVNYVNGVKLNSPKYYVKGARLNLYPPNFKLYRTSRGIKKPIKEYMTYEQAKEKIGLDEPTYSKSIKLSETNGQFNSKIVYEHYNIKRKKKLKNSVNIKSSSDNRNKISDNIFFLSLKNCIKCAFNSISNKINKLCARNKKRLNNTGEKRE